MERKMHWWRRKGRGHCGLIDRCENLNESSVM